MPEGKARPSSDARLEILGRHVASLAAMGRTVETQMEHRAVMRRGRPVYHILHLLLCISASGLWANIWLYLAVTGGERRERNIETCHQDVAAVLESPAVFSERVWHPARSDRGAVPGEVSGTLSTCFVCAESFWLRPV